LPNQAQYLVPLNEEVATYYSDAAVPPDQQKAFWENVPVSFKIGPKSEQTIKNLIAFNREIDLMNVLRFELEELSDSSIFSLANGMFSSLEKKDENWLRSSNFVEPMIGILKQVRVRKLWEIKKIASHEFAFAKNFRHSNNRYPLAINELATNNAKYITELISMVYVSEFGAPTEQIDENKSDLAWHLIKQIEVPDLKSKKYFDPAPIVSWIELCKIEFEKTGYFAIGMEIVGQILARSSKDPEDRIWPRREVRDIIEIHHQKNLSEGIVTELFNNYGTFSYGEYFFGKKANARKYASKFMDAWPKTKMLLNQIEKSDRESAEYHRKRDDSKLQNINL